MAGRSEAWSGGAGPTVTRVGDALIVALPRELDDDVLGALRSRTLDQVRQTGVRAVVFEASGLDVVDAADHFDRLGPPLLARLRIDRDDCLPTPMDNSAPT